MIIRNLIPFFVFCTINTFGQISDVQEKFELPASISESSGAIFFNNKLITHNDSGGENKLYELDTISGLVTRTVTISNAINTDWEAIAQDDAFIYIGDFGNYNGIRTDLKIYKISKSDYISSDNISAETIAFNYSDQIDFTETDSSQWDAEALVSLDATHLIVFTKNWVDGISKAYLIPKEAGTYMVTASATPLNSGGLITDATLNVLTGKLYLVGYSKRLEPFVWICYNFNADDVFSGTNTQTQLSSLGQEQIEGITFVGENRYLVTSESFTVIVGPYTVSDVAKLISFSTNDATLSNDSFKNENEVVLFPNPVHDFLKVKSKEMTSIQIFDTKLTQLYSGNDTAIDMSKFSQGVYIVKINLNHSNSVIKRIIKH